MTKRSYTVNGQVCGSDNTGGGVTLTTRVIAGTHTLRLCGQDQSSTELAELPIANLTAQWTAGGSVHVASGSTSAVGISGVLGE